MIENFSIVRLGLVVCHACGRAFKPAPDQRYTARKREVVSIFSFANEDLYDAFDCPLCGCQNLIGPRLPRISLDKEEPAAKKAEAPVTLNLGIDTKAVARAVFTAAARSGDGPEEPSDFTNE